MKRFLTLGLLVVLAFFLTSCNNEIVKEEKVIITLKNDLEDVIEELHVIKNTEVMLPIIDQKGKSFVGWYHNLEKEDSRVELAIRTSEDITLYGKWELATQGLEFELVDDEYVVIGYHGSSNEVTIPGHHQAKRVTKIGNQAFYENQIIKMVVLPDSINTIGEEAFFTARNLEKINFSPYLETIGNSAFKFCDNLEITKIDAIKIGDSAFDTCPKISTLTLSNRVKSIGDYAFYSNSSLAEITILENVEEIGEHAFSWCRSIKFYTSVKNQEKLSDLLTNISLIYIEYTIVTIN